MIKLIESWKYNILAFFSSLGSVTISVSNEDLEYTGRVLLIITALISIFKGVDKFFDHRISNFIKYKIMRLKRPGDRL